MTKKLTTNLYIFADIKLGLVEQGTRGALLAPKLDGKLHSIESIWLACGFA